MRVFLSAILVLFTGSAYADSPIDCVNPDVANTLLNTYGQLEHGISYSIPEGTEVPNMPSALELIGSRSMQSAVVVAYKSPQAREATLDAIRGQAQSGWTHVDQMSSAPYGGFRLKALAPTHTNLSLCHDRHGRAQFSVWPAGKTGAYVTVMLYQRDGNATCAPMEHPMRLMMKRLEIPVLLLPEGSRLLSSDGPGGGGSSTSAGAVFDTSLPMATVLSSFNDQLLKQGWSLEGAWSGSSTQGSSWIDQDGNRYGVLSLAALGGTVYKGVFNSMNMEHVAGSTTSTMNVIQTN